MRTEEPAPDDDGESRGAWRHPDLRRLGAVHFLLEAEFWFPIWIVYLRERGIGPVAVFLIDGYFRGVMVLAEVPMGRLSDRIGRRRFYLVVAGLAVAAYVAILAVGGLVTLVAAWTLWGLFWAAASGTDVAFQYELLRDTGHERRAAGVLGQFRAISAAAVIVSVGTASYLYGIDPRVPWVVHLAFAVVALVLIRRLPDQRPTPAPGRARGARPSPWPPAEGSGRSSAARRWVGELRGVAPFGPLALLVVVTVLWWSPRILVQPTLTGLGWAPEDFSVVFVLYAGGSLAAGLLLAPLLERSSRRAAIAGGLAVLALGSAAWAVGGAGLAIAGIVATSVGATCSVTLAELGVSESTTDDRRASALSVANLVASVVMLFVRPGLGLGLEEVGRPATLGTWTVLAAVAAVVVLVRAGRPRRAHS